MSSNGGSRRRELDVAKLSMDKKFVVHTSDSAFEFWIELQGPENTPYAGGMWVLHTSLPVDYPHKSPSIGFANRIFHPNVDEASGSVCLDVLNQTWTPLYELSNVFEIFIPQLLAYPNPTDPLNTEAAKLLLTDSVAFASRVQEHVRRYATPAEARNGLHRWHVTELNPKSILCSLKREEEATKEPSNAPASQKGDASESDEYEPVEIDI